MEEFSLDEFLPVSQEQKEIANLSTIYKNYPIIQYALDEIVKNDTNKFNDYASMLLTDDQFEYIKRFDNSDFKSLADVCMDMGISKSTVILWNKTNKLFAAVIELLKQTEAEQAESVLWAKATNPESVDAISRMFALKARKPEYRENAIIPGANVVSIRVTIDNKEFDTSASVKDITDNRE